MEILMLADPAVIRVILWQSPGILMQLSLDMKASPINLLDAPSAMPRLSSCGNLRPRLGIPPGGEPGSGLRLTMQLQVDRRIQTHASLGLPPLDGKRRQQIEIHVDLTTLRHGNTTQALWGIAVVTQGIAMQRDWEDVDSRLAVCTFDHGDHGFALAAVSGVRSLLRNPSHLRTIHPPGTISPSMQTGQTFVQLQR
jgi:hypothetical protein